MSSDAYVLYVDGGGKCFSCGVSDSSSSKGSYDSPRSDTPRPLISDIDIKPIKKRGITQATCEKWGYGYSTYNGKKVQVASYRDSKGALIAQKLRFKDKSFLTTGDFKNVSLFGSWLWRESGKMIVITEGEIDALSVSQLQDNKWPVVSIPAGAQGAKKSVQQNLEYLEQFDKVIFMFDQDEPGRKAVEECCDVLSPGKAYIATLPLKDANEMLMAGRGDEVRSAMWDAKQYSPAGIIDAAELWGELITPNTEESLEYPWPFLNTMTHGMRTSEIVTITSGSGMGKSQFCREIGHHILKSGDNLGYIALEESKKRTVLGLMSIDLSKPLHVMQNNPEELKESEEAQQSFQSLFVSGESRCYIYDHFGSVTPESLISKIRYLAKGLECKWIILDHISIVVSGIADGDERRLIDNLMTRLRTVVEELNIGLLLISHVKRNTGGAKGFERGSEISLSDLRGSSAIEGLSDMVIGLERNQQEEDEEQRHITKVRILKNRFTGETGVAGCLKYSPETTRLTDYEEPEFDDVEEQEGVDDY